MSYIDPKVSEYISNYYRPLNSGLALLREQCESEGVPLILRETELFLRVYLSALRPHNILEIGTAYGYSAAFFATLLPEASVTTIERDPASCDKASANIKALGLDDRIKVLRGDAGEVISGLDMGTYDFVFIDAGKSHYSEYLRAAEPHCVKGAVVVCDNILMHGILVSDKHETVRKHHTNIRRMKEFTDDISAREDIETAVISTGDGLAIIKLN